MKPVRLLLLPLLFLAGCGRQEGQPQANRPEPQAGPQPGAPASLAEARRGFQTRLLRQQAAHEPVPEPPPKLFRTVRYESTAGKLAAYLSKDPGDGKKHPAIIWIFGGFDNGIGETAWEKAPPSNDQSARAFREAGIVMMYPSLRGGNDNPGFKEGFFGEVDDVLAAADFLARQDFVDPKRIYLGGHSTGGTLALLAAEAGGDRFRAAFSFGPVHSVAGYGADNLHFDTSNRRELELRAPILWLDSIRCPTFVFEGTEQGNLAALEALARVCRNPLVHFYPVRGATHFSTLAPLTRLIARKVVRDDGPKSNLAFTEEEVNNANAR